MSRFDLKNSAKVLFIFLMVGGATIPTQVIGQTPVAQTKHRNAKATPQQPGESDEERIQGTWQIMLIDVGSKVIKREDNLEEWKGTFATETFFKGERTGQIGHSNAKFKLDVTRDPKQITLHHDDGSNLIFRGIYHLEGDTLTICMNGDGTSVCRPEEFVTKQGQAVIISKFQRVMAKK